MEVNNNIPDVQSGTPTMKTVLQTLANYASSQPDQKVWSFLNDSGEHVTDSYSYSELESSTTELANQLKTVHKLNHGDRALLVFFPGLAFTAALIACFKAGIITVPVFPPDPRKLQKDLDHFISIQTSSQAKIVLTHTLYNYAKKVTDLQRMFNTKKATHQWPTNLQWIVVDDILSKAKTNKLPIINTSAPSSSSTTTASNMNLNDIAFLQYTSGSTSEPKGVMISHANLAHNLTLITKELAVDTSTINVSWLPQYHDMGLIGSYLGTLYCGGTGYYLSPISFLKDPNVWLKAVSKYRGSHTQAPNFAFALAARKFTDYCKEHSSSTSSEIQLDLSCVKHMINAAEPVDVAAIHHFYTVFGKYGLQKGVVVPTYGLAEHTVFVCSDGQTVLTLNKESLENGTVEIVTQKLLKDCENTGINEHDDNQQQQQHRTQMIVGCGLPEKGESVVVKIVDPVTLLLVDDGKVGEIWVTSPSKAQGYWNQPELTQDAFFAHITSSSSATSGGDAATATKAVVVDADSVEDTKSATNTYDFNVIDDTNGYLRTGDMGFLYHKELFICGRIKDLIIIRGSNHYPQDIEKTAENASNLLRQGCSAAFAIQHESAHTEAVVFVAELKQNVPKSEYEKTVQAIRNAVNKEHGISLTCVCLLEPKTVIKTTSGKISRAGCRKAYQNQSLLILHKWEGIINDNNNASDDDELLAVLPPDDLEGGENNDDGNINSANKNNSSNKKGGAKPLQLPKLTKQQVRELELTEIAALLETTLVSVSSQGPSPLTAPIDTHASLISLGLDSFTVVQFKVVLDKRFHCTDIPDEFLFTNSATLEELSKAVKHGSLTTEQRSQFDGVGGGGAITGGGTGQHSSSTNHEVTTDVNGNEVINKTATATTVIEQRTPLCPWFTCCY